MMWPEAQKPAKASCQKIDSPANHAGALPVRPNQPFILALKAWRPETKTFQHPAAAPGRFRRTDDLR